MTYTGIRTASWVFWISICIVSTVAAQRFDGGGDLQTNVQAVSRLGGNDLLPGDLVHVGVRAGDGGEAFYVSVHAQYQLENGDWEEMHAANSQLGQSYRGSTYGDFRDFVRLNSPGSSAKHTVVLFMPYRAAAITEGPHVQRYVLRIFAADARTELQAIALPAERVDVINSHGANGMESLIVRVSVRTACAAYTVDGSLEPIPDNEPVMASITRKFNVDGSWQCSN